MTSYLDIDADLRAEYQAESRAQYDAILAPLLARHDAETERVLARHDARTAKALADFDRWRRRAVYPAIAAIIIVTLLGMLAIVALS
jgi:hypothetical protein